MDHPASTWINNAIGTGTLIAVFAGYIPAMGAMVALVYYVIQIYESETVQRWLAGRRVRKIARLKARVIMMEARSRVAPLLPSTPDDSGMPMKSLD